MPIKSLAKMICLEGGNGNGNGSGSILWKLEPNLVINVYLFDIFLIVYLKTPGKRT